MARVTTVFYATAWQTEIQESQSTMAEISSQKTGKDTLTCGVVGWAKPSIAAGPAEADMASPLGSGRPWFASPWPLRVRTVLRTSS